MLYRDVTIRTSRNRLNNAATQLLAMCATVGGQIDELSR